MHNSHFVGPETTVGDGVENQNILFFFTEPEIPLRVAFVFPECSCSECASKLYVHLIHASKLYAHPLIESIHAKSKSGYFSTRRYRNPPSPPSPSPQFSEPSQLGRTPYWDRYVTVMPALFKCKQSEAPALTLFATPQLF